MKIGIHSAKVLWIFFLVSVILTENVTKGDITEYFLRDPYSQLDLFQHSNLLDNKKKEDQLSEIGSSDEENNEKSNNQLEELLKQGIYWVYARINSYCVNDRLSQKKVFIRFKCVPLDKNGIGFIIKTSQIKTIQKFWQKKNKFL